MRHETNSSASFRKVFTLSAPVNGHMEIIAYKDLALWIDGEPIQFSKPLSWKKAIEIKLPSLSEGQHQLTLRVANHMAPPLFLLNSTLPYLDDSQGWESSTDQVHWLPALRAEEKREPPVCNFFPTLLQSLLNLKWPLSAIFVASLALAIKCWPAARVLRFALHLLVAALCINNMLHLSVTQGFDGPDHLNYINYIIQNSRLPLASEGSQMFQSPFYYLVAATLMGAARMFCSQSTAQLLLSFLAMGCAMMLVEVSYRILKELFPQRDDLQGCGLLVASLLPMNLYMCQFVGNEPLTGALTGLLLLLVIKTFHAERNWRATELPLLGGLAGLCLLTKFTPIVLFPLVCALILCVPRQTEEPRVRLQSVTLFLATGALVAGWYFARNYAIFGKPFVGGWDTARQIIWWQDPGYRLSSDYFSFGSALRQPVFSAFNGFLDGFYSTLWSDGYLSGNADVSIRPPWKYEWMAASTALSVVPCLMLVGGIANALWRSDERGRWPFLFLALAILAYLAALCHLHLSLPIYSTAKASYTMGLTPAYAIMVATGAGLVLRGRYTRLVFLALLATWATATYAAFFIV